MIDPCELPGVLADIAEVAGVPAALKIASARGGTVAYIPRADFLSHCHWLVEAVGADAARKICQRLGQGQAEIPLGPYAGNRGQVRRAISQALAQGQSESSAARLAGVHVRTVRRHKAGRGDERDDQHSLI